MTATGPTEPTNPQPPTTPNPATPPSSGATGASGPSGPTGAAPPIGFNPEQQDYINRLMGQARADGRAAAERAAAEAEAERQRRAQQDADAARGEFDKVRGELESERNTLKSERDSLVSRLADYEDRERKRIERGLADIPDDLKAFDPGADAPLDQRAAWFDKAALVAAERAKTAPTNLRTPQTPRPNPQGLQGADDAAARARAARPYTG